MRPARGKTSADGRGVGPSWAALMDVRWPESLGSRFVSGTTPLDRTNPEEATAHAQLRRPRREPFVPLSGETETTTMTATTLHAEAACLDPECSARALGGTR